uniref:SJCHGC04055 protein n=1 Tax=Schistosoma japonicum TaxID=6182 RepID=Q5DED0_SCHJA|nr:SJCHGC04055 protein [Schistosoma japonicum]
MPDISEYRLGSACRIKNSDHLLEKVDPKFSTANSSDVETSNSEKYMALYQEVEHVTTDKASVSNDCSYNNFSDMDKFTCCCHESGNELLTLNNSNSTSWLRRLFTSSLFNMDMTIQYLFKSDDVAVQMYLGKYDLPMNLFFILDPHICFDRL